MGKYILLVILLFFNSVSLLAVTKKKMIFDALAFNGASFGYAYIADQLPGHHLDTGMYLRMEQDGSVKRAFQEFFNPFSWRLTPAPAPGGGIDPNKGIKTIAIHPSIGFEFANLLQSKGYSRTETIFTTGMGFYILEKGLQGSFETPSLQDIGSYYAGVGLSLFTYPVSTYLWNSGVFWKQVIAVPLDPFIVF